MNLESVIGIYPGRFQPPHRGHLNAYNVLKLITGNDTYVSTSGKVELPDSPLTFGLSEAMTIDVANFILQGEFTGSYNQQQTEDLKSKATSIMKKNDVPIQK